MHHAIHAVKGGQNGVAAPDIAMDKVHRQIAQVFPFAQFFVVQHPDQGRTAFFMQPVNQVGPDESASPGDQKSVHFGYPKILKSV